MSDIYPLKLFHSLTASLTRSISYAPCSAPTCDIVPSLSLSRGTFPTASAPARDTHFPARNPVSREESARKWPFSVRDTHFPSQNHVSGASPRLPGRFRCAIQRNPAKRVCRGRGSCQNWSPRLAIHTFPAKTLCREQGKPVNPYHLEDLPRGRITDGRRRSAEGVLPAG